MTDQYGCFGKIRMALQLLQKNVRERISWL